MAIAPLLRKDSLNFGESGTKGAAHRHIGNLLNRRRCQG